MAFNWRKFPWTNLHDLNLDWIIQTVKTLENNLADAVSTFREMIDAAVAPVDSKLDTEISNRASGDAALQSAANTERTERLAGDAALQTEIEKGVYPTISRNINDVNTSINTERTERIAGDAALQSTIDDVIMPRLDSISAASNSYVLLVTGTESTESDIALTSEQVTALQNAAQNKYPITMILRDGDSYTAYYSIDVGNTSMVFGKVNNFNSAVGSVDVNQALGRIVVALVDIQNGAGTLSFIEFPSGLTRFLPCSISITWTAEANSYTLTDAEYAILRQSLLDKRPVFIVRNTADAGGEQTIYMLQTCATPSILNVDSMTLILQGPSNNSIKVQMASKTIVPDIQ